MPYPIRILIAALCLCIAIPAFLDFLRLYRLAHRPRRRRAAGRDERTPRVIGGVTLVAVDDYRLTLRRPGAWRARFDDIGDWRVTARRDPDHWTILVGDEEWAVGTIDDAPQPNYPPDALIAGAVRLTLGGIRGRAGALYDDIIRDPERHYFDQWRIDQAEALRLHATLALSPFLDEPFDDADIERFAQAARLALDAKGRTERFALNELSLTLSAIALASVVMDVKLIALADLGLLTAVLTRPLLLVAAAAWRRRRDA